MANYCFDECRVTSKKELNRMVQCEGECENWYHYICVGIKSHKEAEAIENWTCTNCQTQQPNPQNSQPNRGELISPSQPAIFESPLRPILTPNPQVNDNDAASQIDQDDHLPLNASQSEYDENYQPRTPQLGTTSPRTSLSQETQTNSDGDDDEPIPDQHYIVEKIVAHSKVGRNLEYKVRWKGETESEDRWFMEKDLESCYEILTAYKMEHSLGEPTIPKPRFGASTNEPTPYNRSNWASLDEILESIQTYATKSYPRPIEIKLFQETLPEDTIYVIPVGNHVLVGMHMVKEHKIYIADGGNLFRKYQRIQDQVMRKIGPNLNYVAVEFNRQKAVDFCASSAASIAIEFRRIYGTGQDVPKEIMVERFTQSKITSKFHKEPSEPLIGFRPVRTNIAENQCPTCGKRYITRNRSAFLAHTRLCGKTK